MNTKKFNLLGYVCILLTTSFFTTLSAQCEFLNEDFSNPITLAPSDVDGAWYPDRYPPFAFESNGGNLKISINAIDGAQNRPPAYSTAFYNTQGRKYNNCGRCVNKVTSRIFVPSDWQTKKRRSDLWATAYDVSNSISAYPILGYRNVDGASGNFFYFDVILGIWVASTEPVIYDDWNELSFELIGSNLIYKVNGVQIGSISSNASTYFDNTILQAYNFNDNTLGVSYDPTADNTYDALWDDIIVGTSGSNVSNQNTGENFCTIQAAIDDPETLDGHVIEISEGSFTEVITINKALTISGPNVGINGNALRSPEAVLLNCSIDINTPGTVILDGLHILRNDDTALDQIILDGSGTNTIQNCIFERNGTIAGVFARAIATSASGTAKNILNNKITGDVSGGLFSGHKTWNNGLYINAGTSPVTISGNTIMNSRSGINIDDYNNSLSISGNTFNNNGTHFSLGGTVPTTGSYALGVNNFINNAATTMVNLSNVDETFRLNISTSTLNGINFASLTNPQLFEVEARIAHKEVTASKKGKVIYVNNNQYVNNFTTPVTKIDIIQNSVKYADVNDIINLEDGNYNQKVIINKSNITLKGITNDKTLYVLDGTGLGTNSGIYLDNNFTNISIQNLTVQNFTGASGNANAGIYANANNNNLNIDNVALLNNATASGFYANGPINNVSITNSMVNNNGSGARGIVIWNGLKTNITITNNMVNNNNCCGIELQDGNASNVNISNNNLNIGGGDNAIGIVGLNSSIAPNLINGNTITGGGRFGIEIKNPSGGVSVANNNVTLTSPPNDGLGRDRAGIAVFRRGVTSGNADIPNGVAITGNTVAGAQQTSNSEGFGIVIEGTNHTVTGNTLNNNDVGILQQQNPSNYPGDADQSNVVDLYFGRGNSPQTCNNTISGNMFSGNTLDTRDLGVGGGLVTNTTTLETFCSIQSAIDDAQTLSGHTLQVSSGTYNEDVVINKSIHLMGSGSSTTSIIGPIGGNGATVQVSAPNVLVEGFTISRAGNNVADWNLALNVAGIAIQGLTVNAEIRNNVITGNRNGIDINNSNNNNIHNNQIVFNRTGLIFRNQTDNTLFNENVVNDNWTVGILFLDASSGTNVPLQQALNSSFNNNIISGNWYGDVVDRQTGGSLPAPGTTNLKNFECNWYGSTLPVVSTANSVEPGYAALIPVAYGGSAVPPGGQPNILGAASANIDFETFLTSGMDSDGMESGFQPQANSCNGCLAGINLVQNISTGEYFCSIQSAIDDTQTDNGDTIVITAGTYIENLFLNKSLTILGPNQDINPNSGSRIAEAIIYPATSDPDYNTSSVVILYMDENATGSKIEGLTFDGDNPNLIINGIDAIEAIASYDGVGNVTINNNIIKNLSYTGIDLYNYYNGGVATSNNYITNNKIENLLDVINVQKYEIGILIYNNFYADISNNVISGVRVGVQTGNFSNANPGSTQSISNNNIQSRSRGIFKNLSYNNAGTFTIANNVLTTAMGSTTNIGLSLSSIGGSVSTIINNNNIDGAYAGVDFWNCTTSNFTTVNGGSITNCQYGIVASNYDGYNSDANNSEVKVSGVSISGSTIAGIHVKDNPSNTNNATIKLTVENDCNITGSSHLLNGILISGSDASAVINNNDASIHGFAVGIDVDAGQATITNNHIYDNGIGVRVANGGTANINTNNFNGISLNGRDIQIAATAGVVNATPNNYFSGSTFGIENLSALNISATLNYWNSPSGPGPVGTGSGSNITNNVDYCPWLNDIPVAFGGTGSGGVSLVKNATTNIFYCTIQSALDASLVGEEVHFISGTASETLHIDNGKKLVILADAKLNVSTSLIINPGGNVMVNNDGELYTLPNSLFRNNGQINVMPSAIFINRGTYKGRGIYVGDFINGVNGAVNPGN